MKHAIQLSVHDVDGGDAGDDDDDDDNEDGGNWENVVQTSGMKMKIFLIFIFLQYSSSVSTPSLSTIQYDFIDGLPYFKYDRDRFYQQQ